MEESNQRSHRMDGFFRSAEVENEVTIALQLQINSQFWLAFSELLLQFYRNLHLIPPDY